MSFAAVVLSLFVDVREAEGLRRTAPTYLDVATAREHVDAAELAGTAYLVDPDLLLSIAFHESRYQGSTVTPETGGKVSCGVMTPEPTHDKRSCLSATASITAGYSRGAEHLRGWLDACRGSLNCALLGYAGGYHLIALCRADGSAHACSIPETFTQRAAWIRAERHRSGVHR